MNNQVPEKRIYDAYEFKTSDISQLVKEVADMEANSQWTSGIISKRISLEAIGGPIFAQELSDRYNINLDTVLDTANDGTKLLLSLDGSVKCIRDTARGSLYETAKLNGSALGRMSPHCLAETLNYGLAVAKGGTLMLERYGKVSALHSDASGGYRIMPISELLRIVQAELHSRFGTPDFKYGRNSHSCTYALWELPDVQGELIDKYQRALTNAVSYNHAINFMPSVRFSSSDTAASSVMLIPMFKLSADVYFRLGDGIQVQHKRSVRSGALDGIELFESRVGELFAKFNESMEVVKKMGSTEIWNPVNCLVGICNKLRIPKKYANIARDEVEIFAMNSPVCSMHDIFLSLAGCIGYARQAGASESSIVNLEESIAKVLTMDWSEFDVGGIVAWGNVA